MKSFTSARSALRTAREVGDEAVVDRSTLAQAEPQAEDREKRLDHARALLQLAAAQPKGPRVAQPSSVPKTSPGTPLDRASAFEDDADPFEPFEQCATIAAAPAEAEEPVYTRSSQRKRKPSASEIRKNASRPKLSLKGRALGYLSRREHSRAELSRKLKPYVEETDSLDTVLDDLERDGWLSNARFVESVVHRRAAQMGGKRIIHELKHHAVGDALIGETAGQLAQTETARAQSVWAKKFGTAPETPAERAKQARFLASRGFSASTIGKVLKGADEDFPDDFTDD